MAARTTKTRDYVVVRKHDLSEVVAARLGGVADELNDEQLEALAPSGKWTGLVYEHVGEFPARNSAHARRLAGLELELDAGDEAQLVAVSLGNWQDGAVRGTRGIEEAA